MHAGREPFAADDRHGRQRRARDDVGLAHRALEVRHDRGAHAIPLQRRGGLARRAPPCGSTRSRDRSAGRSGARRPASARSGRNRPARDAAHPRARAGRAAYADAPAVRRAVISSPSNIASAVPLRGVEERVHGADRALAAPGVARKHGDELHADAPARAPGRHQQQRCRRLARNVDRMARAQRRGDVVLQHRVERRQHPRPGQALANRGGVEISHRAETPGAGAAARRAVTRRPRRARAARRFRRRPRC